MKYFHAQMVRELIMNVQNGDHWPPCNRNKEDVFILSQTNYYGKQMTVLCTVLVTKITIDSVAALLSLTH